MKKPLAILPGERLRIDGVEFENIGQSTMYVGREGNLFWRSARGMGTKTVEYSGPLACGFRQDVIEYDRTKRKSKRKKGGKA